MQEKGLLAPRRSRHRLTPGTVKFAAFHVLSLEGSEGLTVLELAEKIQVSIIFLLTENFDTAFSLLILIRNLRISQLHRDLDLEIYLQAEHQRLLFLLL